MSLVGSKGNLLSTRNAKRYSELAYLKKTIRVNEVECYVDTTTINGKILQVVAFRGTEAKVVTDLGIFDVLRDMFFLPWYNKKVGWGHAGFMCGAAGAYEKGLYGLLRRGIPVAVVGHSLGGAMALVVARMLLSDGFSVTDVVTFGAPKTFLWNTANKSKKVFRKKGVNCRQYVNEGDPVACLPPFWLGFKHINEVELKSRKMGLEAHYLENYKILF